MPLEQLPILDAYYDVQRFKQFSPQDCANFYQVAAPSGKQQKALYPCMGRKHINYLNQVRFAYSAQPRKIFRSIDYMYVVVGNTIYQYDSEFREVILRNPDFNKVKGALNFAYLPTVQELASSAGNFVQPTYCMLCDGSKIFIIDEHTTDPNAVFLTVTDPDAPVNPLYVAAFGNRFVVSGRGSTEFRLTQINLGTNPVDVSTVFQVGGQAVFAQESGIIQQMAVLHNQLYLFTDFTTGIWSNTPSTFNTTAFPWKKNTSYDWDSGMSDPESLAVDFGMMCWLGKNKSGLQQFMVSDGNKPQPFSTQAISILLQKNADTDALSPFIGQDTNGFLYQYENTVFYRASANAFYNFDDSSITSSANCIEFNFDTQNWHRCIEVNGDRNRIQNHVYFSNRHIVSVERSDELYEMAGNIYINEERNPEQPDINAADAFLKMPMRYEIVSPIIYKEGYVEFKTDWVQVDFVWGMETFIRADAPFENTVYLVAEESTEENPVYLAEEDGETLIIAEGSNTPGLNEVTYYDMFKPHIEMYVSDDGGISYYSIDVLEFSQLGVYQWRMRWNRCGISRNRVYKLEIVSPAPIIILGATMLTSVVSGGAG